MLPLPLPARYSKTTLLTNSDDLRPEIVERINIRLNRHDRTAHVATRVDQAGRWSRRREAGAGLVTVQRAVGLLVVRAEYEQL